MAAHETKIIKPKTMITATVKRIITSALFLLTEIVNGKAIFLVSLKMETHSIFFKCLMMMINIMGIANPTRATAPPTM